MPLRLGLLGAWHPHADGMVRRIAEHPEEFTLVGFCEAEGALAVRRKAAWDGLFPGGVVLFDSPESVLTSGLDAVVVEGRVLENVALARRAVDAGFPVLLEKPGGVNFEDFDLLHEAAARRGLHVQMSYLFRSMSAVKEMFRLARDGELGDLYEFRGRLPKPLHEYADQVRDLGIYPAGVFFEMAGHLIDFLVTLLGPPRKVRSVLAHHHRAVPGPFIDNGAALLECEHGIGLVEVPALEAAPSSRRIEVYGTRGAAVIPHLGSGHLANNATQPLDVARNGATSWERIELPAATLQISDLREFAAVVTGRKRPTWSPAHDLAVQKALIEACRIE